MPRTVLVLIIALGTGCSDSAGSASTEEPAQPMAAKQPMQRERVPQSSEPEAAGAPPRTAPVPQFASGTRLHAQHYVADGAEAFVSFYDTELTAECAFQKSPSWPDLRCVPTHSNMVRVVYLDDRCTQPAAAYGAGDGSGPPPGRWVSDQAGEHLYTVGEQIHRAGSVNDVATQPPLFTLASGHCESQGHDCGLLGCSVSRLTLREDVAMVAGHVTQLEVGGGFSIDRITSDDGAALTLGARDDAGVACSFAPDGQCIPGRLATEGEGKNVFIDATCTTLGLAPDDAIGALAPVQAADVRYTVRMDGATAHVYALEQRPGYFYQYGFDDALQPQGDCLPLPSDSPVHVPGAEVNTHFTTARKRTTGNGPLHVEHFAPVGDEKALTTASFTSLAPPTGFVDAQGMACSILSDESGTLRCFSSALNLYERQYWADPSCSERLFTTRRDAPANAEYMFARNELPERWAFYAAIRYDGPLYQVVTTQCESLAGTASIPLYRRGAKLSPATLPSVTLE